MKDYAALKAWAEGPVPPRYLFQEVARQILALLAEVERKDAALRLAANILPLPTSAPNTTKVGAIEAARAVAATLAPLPGKDGPR